MLVLENPGPQNTDGTVALAIERAMRDGLPIVCATTEGGAGVALAEAAKQMGYRGRIVIVTHANGSRKPGENALKPENREKLIADGATLVTAAHALSGVERGISTQFGGVYPAELIAQSLRMLSQGVKVAVEIGCMALDAGAIEYGEDIVCAGGTGKGLDTAVVMRPAHAKSIFETKVHEILCMPY